MTLFGIEHAGFYLAAYLFATYVCTMVFMLVFADDSTVGPAGLLVFVILWPFFVGRGFVRAVVKGWREHNPRPDKPRGDKLGGSGSFQ